MRAEGSKDVSGKEISMSKHMKPWLRNREKKEGSLAFGEQYVAELIEAVVQARSSVPVRRRYPDKRIWCHPRCI